MRRRLQFSLTSCFVLTTIVAIVTWWTTTGNPYTDFYAGIVDGRLKYRFDDTLIDRRWTTGRLLKDVGVQVDRLKIESTLEFKTSSTVGTSTRTTYRRMSPSYVLLVEEEDINGTWFVYSAEVLFSQLDVDDNEED